MRVQPVSADLLIKLGVGVVLLGGAAMLIYTIKSQISAAKGWAANNLDPTNPENVAYGTVNTWGGAIVDDTGAGKNADGSWSLGGWIYDITHPDVTEEIAGITRPTIKIFPKNPHPNEG